MIECEVPFEQVKDVFLEQNPHPAFGTSPYAWACRERRTGSLVLGASTADFELIPVSGSTAADAVRRVDLLPPAHSCGQRIGEMSRGPLSAVFLSAAPVVEPAYTDYRDLVHRGFKGLTHLDGLHRLIAWHGRAGRMSQLM